MSTSAPSSAPSPAPAPKRSHGKSSGYQPVQQDEANDEVELQMEMDALEPATLPSSRHDRHYRNVTYILCACVIVLLASTVYLALPMSFTGHGSGACRQVDVPQYFQTSPELWPGPTATGKAAFMAQTRTFDPTATYVPNEPLQTSVPIDGMGVDSPSIFKMMGFLSPYSPSPGFGVDEYPLPIGADIIQVQMLSRHGSRYPTTGSNVVKLGERIAETADSATFKGSLGFLKDWRYRLGAEILVPKGRQELYDSGEPSFFTERLDDLI
jgi:hypothetical protein